LFDVGQVVELVSFSNINADIRSIEVFSPEDSLMYEEIEIFILTRMFFVTVDQTLQDTTMGIQVM
jgi:hypothetical protein